MITFTNKGSFSKTNKFLKETSFSSQTDILNRYGKEGVNALRAATPTDSGETANAWSYEVIKTKRGMKLVWSNSHVINGVNIAVILQYGHGTNNGGWVEGRDYINPALQSIFDNIADSAWKEVTRS